MFTSSMHVLFLKNTLLKGTKITEHKVIFVIAQCPLFIPPGNSRKLMAFCSDSFNEHKMGYWTVIALLNSTSHKKVCVWMADYFFFFKILSRCSLNIYVFV